MVKIDKWGDVVVAPTEFGTDGTEILGYNLRVPSMSFTSAWAPQGVGK